MTVGDLIKSKDYDYISWRMTLPEKAGGDTFAGCAASRNGELISLDGDTIYSKDEEVFNYEEWSKPEEGIQHGLTVVVEGEWI